MTSEQPFVENYLAFLLAKTSHLVSGSFHRRLRKMGISISTWRILAVTNDRRRTVGELAELVLLNQSTLSKVLDRLERDGLVTRSRDGDNRRIVHIGITGAGRKLMDSLIPLANTHESESFAHLNDGQKAQLIEILQETIACLDDKE